MKFYSGIKNNEIMLITGKWMELEIITLSEKSQTQKGKYHIFSLICRIYISFKDMKVEKGTIKEEH
jgi:hypothetical protein